MRYTFILKLAPDMRTLYYWLARQKYKVEFIDYDDAYIGFEAIGNNSIIYADGYA